MLEAGETAVEFASNRSRSDLDSDRMLLFALVRAIEVVGESASKVSEELRKAAPGVPWALIVSMRNRLIHAYFDVDRDILWQTATKEIPELLRELRALLEGQR